jgi:tRNA dimethylallyltransferase
MADRLGAEIVSVDSMAVYQGLDIGTAKPGIADRERVPHHLIDVVAPWVT